MEEQEIKKVVAERAQELGGRISPRDVALDFMEGHVAPGYRLFRARWGAGRTEGALSGLIEDEEIVDTYPAQALGKIFQRWMETEGKLPAPELVASTAAYLYDAADRHDLVLGEKEKADLVERPEWLRHVSMPELIEVAGQPGVAFWWVGGRGPSQMRFYLDERGRIRTEEKFVQDFPD